MKRVASCCYRPLARGRLRVLRQAPAVTVFEGARVIVGDGRAPIENATIVVSGARIVQAGPAAQVKAPAGATSVSLAGKTIMPAIVDTHVHTSQTLAELEQDLRRRAYYGVSAAMSLGQDIDDAVFQVRARPLPGAALLFTAGRGITMPEPGRSTAPYWITSAAEARKAVQELAARKVDIVKIWVDDRNGQFKKLTADLYSADHRGVAQAQAARDRSPLHARRCEGVAACRTRRVRPWRPRPRRGRRVHGDGEEAS